MIEKTEQTPEANVSSPDVLPYSGQILCDAREARGLSLEEVASQLCLGVELITALEKDDYESLPPPTFVGGYLRNYARLLGLPENDIIDGYRHYVGGESLSLLAATALQKQAKASDLPVRIVTYLLVTGLGILLIMWWMAQREEMRSLLPEVITAIEPGMVVASRDETKIGDLDKDSTSVEHAPNIKASVTEVAVVNATIDESSSPGQVAALPKETITPTIPALTADMPQTEVMLEFSQESWVEIYDYAGRHLVYDLMPASEILLLQGEAPFNIFLGNAQGVQVFYQKESFDHTPYHRGDLAQFRLGKSSDNKVPNSSEEE